MAGITLNDPEFWTNETYTINHVVSEIGLPQLVKVSEGFYGKDEVESFSSGDLLALDSVKTVSKVVASFIELKKSVIMKEEIECQELIGEIMIPIGYKGKLKLIQCQNNKVYHSVEELIEQFPRYVKTKKCMAVNAADHFFELPVGTELELKRNLTQKGLVCKYNDKDILLNLSDDVEFSLLPDDNVYTLKEIIGRFPLPQFIEFIEPDFQKTLFTDLDEAVHNFKDVTGQLKLDRITKQDVIIGHHKPVTNDDQGLSFCRRTITIIPLDCEELQEIEVQLSRVTDKNIYETIGARTFTDEAMKVIEGGLYLEFKKVPKVHLLQDETATFDCPPPIPPKPVMPAKPNVTVLKEPPKKVPGARCKVVCPSEDANYISIQKPTTTESTNKCTDNQDKLIGEVNYFGFTSGFEEQKIVSINHLQQKHRHSNSSRKEMASEYAARANNCMIFERKFLYGMNDSNVYICLLSEQNVCGVCTDLPRVFCQKKKTEGHGAKHHKESIGQISKKDAGKHAMEQELYPLNYDSDDDPYDTIKTGSLDCYAELAKRKSGLVQLSKGFKFKKKLPKIQFATLREVKDKAKKFVENKLISDTRKEFDNLSISSTEPCTATQKNVYLVSPMISENSNLTYMGDRDRDDSYKVIASQKMTKIGKMSPPVVHVQPHSRDDLRLIRPFRSYNTEETEEIFKKCKGLDDFASLCKKENLNGDFIARLEDKDLREEPFNLGILQVKKIQQLIAGWRP